MILGCHVVSQGHVIKRSFDFIGMSPSRYITILPSLVAMGTVVVEINDFGLSRNLTGLRDEKVI